MVASILAGDSYVDDVLAAKDNQTELYEAILDIENTLGNFGFAIKRVISEKLNYHRWRGMLNSDWSTTDGTFNAEETSETAFHHEYNWKQDTLSIHLNLNPNP